MIIICDFCSRIPVVAAYLCRDFVLPHTPIGSKGAWAACAACADLIDRDQREALTARSFEHAFGLETLSREDQDWYLATMRKLHELFFTHRTGDQVPVDIN